MLVSNRYKDRVERVEKHFLEAFNFACETPPYVIYDPLPFVCGRKKDDIPEGYFGDDPEVMARDQTEKIERHMEVFDDSFSPTLFPFLGTGVLASAFGVENIFREGMDPSVGMATINDIGQLSELRKPIPEVDGLMPKVLKYIRFMKEYSDLPVTITDPQGPLTTALSIVGYENFIYWLYDYPEKMHDFMQLVTDSLIDWIKLQKEIAGHAIDDDTYIEGIRVPEGFGGVCFSDDDSVMFGADLYREFVLPYNSQVLKAFGGGAIHYCGNSNQNVKNYLATDGLTAIHNNYMDNIDAAMVMKNALSEKNIIYYASDYAVADGYIEEYFETMVKKLGKKGLVISSVIAPSVVIDKGVYSYCERDGDILAKKVEAAIKKALKI